MTKPSFLAITPLIPAGPDLDAAVDFYVDQLGFSIAWRSDQMAGIERDRVSFNLVRNTNMEWAENSSFSIGVSDLNELYQHYHQIPARIGPLEVKPWGRLEFHLIVPPGIALQFYQFET